MSTHHYPTDALGNEDQDTETQLSDSRRSLLREQAQATHRRARGRPVYYTEWNTSSNPRDPRHDEPYAAAFIVKSVVEASDLVEGYGLWTFSDIFEENYLPSVPFHGGFGLLTLHGIAKPAYRAFELLHRLGTDRLLVDGLHETVDAWVVRQPAAVTVLLANHALPRHSIETQQVHIRLTDARAPRCAYVERIDEDHANAKRLWREMGEPDYLSASEVERLQAASRLAQEPQGWTYEDGAQASIAVVGFALAAYPVGVERWFWPRAEAVARKLTTLRCFWNGPQGTGTIATVSQGNIANQTIAFFLWDGFWRVGASTPSAACEMVREEGPGETVRTVKHKMTLRLRRLASRKRPLAK